VPEVKGKVEFFDLGTPLSEVTYLSSFHGGSYGTYCGTSMFAKENRSWTTTPHTPVPNLFLSGSDAFLPAVCGYVRNCILTREAKDSGCHFSLHLLVCLLKVPFCDAHHSHYSVLLFHDFTCSAMYGGCFGASAVLGHLRTLKLTLAFISHFAQSLREKDPKLSKMEAYRQAWDKFINE